MANKKRVTCFNCGEQMRESVENVKYDRGGLPSVTLADVTVRNCPSCGEREIVLVHLEALHRAIADAFAEKKSLLVGEEIRFLRKFLGFSGVDFAKHIGVTPETLSRWENRKAQISETADRLIRYMVRSGWRLEHYPEEKTNSPSRIVMRPSRAGWQSRAAGGESRTRVPG